MGHPFSTHTKFSGKVTFLPRQKKLILQKIWHAQQMDNPPHEKMQLKLEFAVEHYLGQSQEKSTTLVPVFMNEKIAVS